jgi:hypothetical protein
VWQQITIAISYQFYYKDSFKDNQGKLKGKNR